ncbi:MAG TPA: hypothetical protein P5556_10315 [Candidatus Gastranaerophilales bacterium]|nr:hypothetical protein [Candidatus Gastranaerophilales bacterium]
MKRIHKLIKDQKKGNVNNSEKKEFNKNFLILCGSIIIYGVLIFIAAEAVNWFLNLEHVQANIMNAVNYLELNLTYEKLIMFVQPHLEPYINLTQTIEGISFLKNWTWLLSYSFFSIIIGIFHPYVFSFVDRHIFKTFLAVSFLVLLLKFVSYMIPYGVSTIIVYFADFVKKYYLNLVILYISCFVSFFIGAEIYTFWRRNIKQEEEIRI